MSSNDRSRSHSHSSQQQRASLTYPENARSDSGANVRRFSQASVRQAPSEQLSVEVQSQSLDAERNAASRRHISKQQRQQFCVKRFRAPFYQHPNFDHRKFLDTIHTHTFCFCTCNSQIAAAYGLIFFSLILIVGGFYMAFIWWNALHLTLAAAGWVIFMFGLCIHYCGRLTFRKEVQTIRKFYEDHYDNEDVPREEAEYLEEHGNRINQRLFNADFTNVLTPQNGQSSGNNVRFQRQPPTSHVSSSGISQRENTSNSENMFEQQGSQLSINMLPQYSPAAPIVEEEIPEIEMAIEETVLQQTQPIITEEIYENQEMVCLHDSPSSTLIPIAECETISDIQQQTLLPNIQDIPNLETITQEPEESITAAISSPNEVPEVEQENLQSLTASNLASAVNDALKDTGEHLVVLPILCESSINNSQTAFENLINDIPEISKNMKKEAMILVGTNRSLKLSKMALRQSIQKRYLYVNEDIFKNKTVPRYLETTNQQISNECQSSSGQSSIELCEDNVYGKIHTSNDIQLAKDQTQNANFASSSVLSNLLQNLFNEQTFSADEDRQTLLFGAIGDDLQEDSDVDSVSGTGSHAFTAYSDGSNFSSTSSFENFTTVDEPLPLEQEPNDVDTLTESQIPLINECLMTESIQPLSTLQNQEMISEQTLQSSLMSQKKICDGQTLSQDAILVVNSLEELRSTISNINLLESVNDSENGQMSNDTITNVTASNSINDQTDQRAQLHKRRNDRISQKTRERSAFFETHETNCNRKLDFKKRYKKFLLVFLTPF